MQRSKTALMPSIAYTLVLVLLVSLIIWHFPAKADAATYEEIRKRRPDLFDPLSGYRIDKQRDPVPDDIPRPSHPVTAEEAAKLIAAGAIALDVFGALQSHYDELDGTWLIAKPHESIPGAVWLPETGRGVLSAKMQAFLADNLQTLTGRDLQKPIVVFCVADCWMSWNAAQRIAALGYKNVYWLRTGTDGWLDSGRGLAVVEPVPVKVD